MSRSIFESDDQRSPHRAIQCRRGRTLAAARPRCVFSGASSGLPGLLHRRAPRGHQPAPGDPRDGNLVQRIDQKNVSAAVYAGPHGRRVRRITEGVARAEQLGDRLADRTDATATFEVADHHRRRVQHRDRWDRTPPSNPRPINVVNGIRFVSARLGGGEHPGEVLKKDGLAAPRLTNHHGPRASAVAENRVQPGQRPTPGQHRRLEFLA